MPVVIRPANADDQFAITAIARAAWLNPFDLDWRRFLLAQWGQDIIGIGQVRPHKDGSRELASIAVVIQGIDFIEITRNIEKPPPLIGDEEDRAGAQLFVDKLMGYEEESEDLAAVEDRGEEV